MKKKLGKNGGFTLVELLIVVAILAIIAAIAIPTVAINLESAKESADAANLSAGRSAGTFEYAKYVYLGADEYTDPDGSDATTTGPVLFYLIPEDGELTKDKPSAYAQSSANSGKVVQVSVNYDTGVVVASWEE